MRVLALVLLAACAPDLRPDDTAADSDEPSTAGEVTHVDHGDGTFTTTVDATDAVAFVYLDLPGRQVVEPEDPAASDLWDIAFRRFEIPTNGGVTGSGGVDVSWVEGADFALLTEEPATGWIADQADANENGVPEYAFGTWFDYDETTHALTPHDRVYVLHATDGLTYKVALQAYYDDAGTSGVLSFLWGPLTPTTPL